ncbi:MAG: helix-hairpin-helix domain-containing protein [Chitinophagaceae bacterium]
MNNSDIASIISLYAKLLDIHGEESMKSKTYANMAFQIDRLEEPLASMDILKLEKIRGIGKQSAMKVKEIIDNNSFQALEELIAKTPSGILELLKIKGIGPKKIGVIWKELDISSPGELLYACEENRLIKYKGFGEKSQQSIKEAVSYYLAHQGFYLYAQVEPIAQQLLSFFKTIFGEEAAFITGAFRRQEDIIEQLEFVLKVPDYLIEEALSNNEFFKEIQIEQGEFRYQYQNQINIILYTDTDEGDSVLFFTSNTEDFNEMFQERFEETNFFQTEEEIFNESTQFYIPPYARTTHSLMNENIEDKILNCIDLKHIKGIIHNHSTWSDGLHTIEEMAQRCIQHGFEYLVMSDHSQTSFYANGLSPDRIKKQQEEIDFLNEKLYPFKIFKSIECDILSDGKLDYDDNILNSFDLVIVSIHQNLQMTEEKAMLRLLEAIKHPCTNILGHPSGRLLLSRKPYPVDYEKLIETCQLHNVAIEINANPRRLDLDAQWISLAEKNNVKLSINPDAHSMEGIMDIRYGVLSAQKALLSFQNNLSSYSLLEFEKYISMQKEKR